MTLFNVAYSTFRYVNPQFRSIKTTANVILNPTRTYVKWMSRQPIEIVNEDEVYDTKDTTEEKFTANKEVSANESIEKKAKPFTVFKHNDQRITSLITKVKSQKKKQDNRMIVLEGYRLINDALKAGVKLETLLFSRRHELKRLNLPSDVQLYMVPHRTIQLWSGLTAPPGVMGIFKTPNKPNYIPSNDLIPLTIICDNVRNPLNLGSIIRAAAAVGCEKLILLKGCADLWNPKVLRGASGAHFRVAIDASPTWADVPSLISEDSDIFIADSNFGDQFLPSYNTETLGPSLGIFNVDPELLKCKSTDENNKNETLKSEPKASFSQKIAKDFILKFPIVPYYTVDYTKKETVLVLAGECEGLTLSSYKFLNERKSIRINIPLVNGVDSLNTGVALGVVTFEIKRQFIKKQNEL